MSSNAQSSRPRPMAVSDPRIGRLFSRAFRAHAQAFNAKAASLGISLQQFLILNALWDQDGVDQTRLSKKLQVQRASLTGVLHALEQAGHVYRAVDPQDGRKLCVFLTPEGAALKQPLQATAGEIGSTAIQGIQASDVEKTIQVVEIIIKNLSEISKEPTAPASMNAIRKKK